MLLYQEDAELLFPARIIPVLRDLRGDEFRQLVDQVQTCEKETDRDSLGFVLMMIRLSKCMTCDTDTYRAINGCTRCATKAISNYRGTDADLFHDWQAACHDVNTWLDSGISPSD